MHPHPDFHHPSPQHHMGMMHSSPTKMHQHGHHGGHVGTSGGAAGGPFHWPQHGEMPMRSAAGGADQAGNLGMDHSGSGMHHYQQQYHGLPYPPISSAASHGGQQPQPQHNRAGTDDVEVMSTDSSSSSSTDSN